MVRRTSALACHVRSSLVHGPAGPVEVRDDDRPLIDALEDIIRRGIAGAMHSKAGTTQAATGGTLVGRGDAAGGQEGREGGGDGDEEEGH